MLDLLRKLRILLSPRDKWFLVGMVLLMTLGAVAEIAGIGLILPVVAVFTKPELMEQNKILQLYAGIVGGESQNRLLLITCGLILLIFAAKNLLLLFIIWLQAKFSSRKEYELVMRLYRLFMYAPYRLHLQKSHVELGVYLQYAREMCNRVLLPLMVLATDALVLLILGAALTVSMPVITFFSVICLILDVLFIYWILRKKNFRAGKKYADTLMVAERFSNDGLRAIKEVKVTGSEDFFISRADAARRAFSSNNMTVYILGQIPRLWLEFAAMFQVLLIFAGMVLLGVPKGTILLSFSLLIAAMSRMLPACSRINYNVTVIRQSLATVEHLWEVMNQTGEKKYDAPALTFSDEISVENLCFGYRSQTPVLKDLSFKIKRLSSTAITGGTGCGKTTLADLILGLLEPDSGSIRVDGRDIRENPVSWRARTGYVPQFIFLLNASIRENIAFGVPAEEIDDEKIIRCLKTAQAWDFVNAMPGKLNSLVGDNGIQLSGGQRQRIGIARALYRDPELLVLDEATSALDNETEQSFIDALENLHGKLTMIIIAHRLSTVEHCDMKIALHNS